MLNVYAKRSHCNRYEEYFTDNLNRNSEKENVQTNSSDQKKQMKMKSMLEEMNIWPIGLLQRFRFLGLLIL